MYRSCFKRFTDIFVSLALLIALLPVLLCIGGIIWAASGGPVLFRQQRAGRYGRTFIIYKFRTMTVSPDQEMQGVVSGDTRITRAGHLLREWSLDELPQLFNVLKGDMSLIGPRPLPVAYVRRYTPGQAKRLLARPGMTGLQQVSCRYDTPWEKKFPFDVYYVQRISFLLDMKIALATIKTILLRPPSAADGGETYEFI